MKAQSTGERARLVDLEHSGVEANALNLERIRALLTGLDHPEGRYPSILIGGTKGKGSTAAMIEHALRAAGYRTGLYTQPHLHTIRERVRIAGSLISSADFEQSLQRVRQAVDRDPAPTTAYEVMTALALDRFATEQVDIAVLEVGLGGRLDATNIVDAELTVLTSISLDHTQILGDTVEAIAREKADLIKPYRYCVSAPQPASAMAVIRDVATAREATLVIAGEAGGAHWDDARPSDLMTARGQLSNLRPALLGHFQRINIPVAATALDCVHASRMAAVPLSAVRAAIEHVAWPGRFEIIDGKPPIILDGAHNVASAQLLRESLQSLYPDEPIGIVLGVMEDKDRAGIVSALLPADQIFATQAAHPRAVAAGDLAGLAADSGVPTTVTQSVAEALIRARAAQTRGIIVVTGSLYVVAEAREALGLASPSQEPPFDAWASAL